ncbi:hypothetical protein PUV47_00885 [Pseudovibrio exalbescens]|uniref:hypothetical protein n=1 Tax=Pseudovibrio exalbescens TaxID=197461 RepID=UPI0023653101|nr:hypothetical protein [Pseudovibrio exalbescens]MDD7908460.1 hypothetical protein [Pseudovibrio exalbescens]
MPQSSISAPVAALAVVCSPLVSAAREPGLSDAHREAVKQTILNWTQALLKNDFDTWRGYWCEEALQMAPHLKRLIGLTAMELMFENKAHCDHRLFDLTDWAVTGRGELAIAANQLTWADDCGETQTVKQVIVLRGRKEDGWKVVALSFGEVKAGSGFTF